MRRRAGGVLLPACILIVFSTAGVAAVVRVARSSAPDSPHRIGQSDIAEDGSARVAVAKASPSAQPSPRATESLSPVPTPETSRQAGASAVSTTPATRAPATKAPMPSTPTCRPGSVQLQAVAATYVDQAAPSKSFGSSSKLFVAGRDKQRNRRALLAFRFPTVPKGCSVHTAALRMTATQATGRRLVVSATRGLWRESSVTWASAPAATGVTSAALLQSTTATWNVARQVAGVSSGATAFFMVRDAAESSPDGDQSAFFGRGSSAVPTLTVRWA